jgi:Entner-Doudoroff aldolase
MSPRTKQVVDEIGRRRASAILRTNDAEAAAPALAAARRAGFRVIEVTLTVPDALAHVRTLASGGDVLVGAGTVLTVEDARAAVEAGARYLVSPVLDEAVVAAAAALDVAMIPGCMTPTELWRAHRAGAPLQKVFPAPAGGPDFVRSCLAPMPFLKLVPTNGVTADNARAYLEAGAHAVGFVAALFPADDLRERRFDRIEARGRELLAACGS